MLAISVLAQEGKRKHIFPIWTYHQRNVTIQGLSLGLVTGFPKGPMFTNTNGVKVELIGIGLLFPLIPSSPVSQSQFEFESKMADGLSERINGLSLSASGGACLCQTNGVVAGLVGEYNTRVNGVSMAFLMNFAEAHNGIQLAVVMNESYRMNGVQIGLSNESKSLKGIQIGLWNKNQKRSLPIINWSFKN